LNDNPKDLTDDRGLPVLNTPLVRHPFLRLRGQVFGYDLICANRVGHPTKEIRGVRGRN